MQVNLGYHPDAFEDLEQAFDPTYNVAYAASFLVELRGRGPLLDPGGGGVIIPARSSPATTIAAKCKRPGAKSDARPIAAPRVQNGRPRPQSPRG